MKKILMVIVAVTFCITMVGIAAATDVVKPSAIMQKEKAAPIPPGMFFTCPVGWTKKANVLACVPSKPAPIKCPTGYQYYEKLNCTANTFFGGCQADGCEIGCFKPAEPPK